MKLIHFGRKYYNESGSMIGVLYHENGERSDWGKVGIALEKGECVEIRPASKAEHDAMVKVTEQSIERAKAAGFGGPWGAPAEPSNAPHEPTLNHDAK